MKSKKENQPRSSKKMVYTKPQLVIYGGIQALTQHSKILGMLDGGSQIGMKRSRA